MTDSNTITLRSHKAAVNRLVAWFADLYDDFGDEVPPPSKTQSIIAAVESNVGVYLKKFVGSCTNGAAFLTSAKTVLKFTIDEKEAVLWGQLWGKHHQNIAKCYGAWQLASKESGNTIVYLVNVEYVPNQVDDKLADCMQRAGQAAFQAIRRNKPGTPTSLNAMTMEHIMALRTVAKEDNRIIGLIDMLVDLTDVGVHIYDLQPDNFRLAADMQTIKLIDPSTPSGTKGHPDSLFFEASHLRGLGISYLLI